MIYGCRGTTERDGAWWEEREKGPEMLVYYGHENGAGKIWRPFYCHNIFRCGVFSLRVSGIPYKTYIFKIIWLLAFVQESVIGTGRFRFTLA